MARGGRCALDGRGFASLLVAYGLIFNSVQANAVSTRAPFAFNIPPLISGIALAFRALLLIIIRGIKASPVWSQWLIPHHRVIVGRRQRIYLPPGILSKCTALSPR